MKLDSQAAGAVAAWIDIAGRLRRNRHEAQQADLLERLRTVAAEHKETAQTIAAGEAREAERQQELAEREAEVAKRRAQIEAMEAKLQAGEGLTSKDLVALQGDIATSQGLLGESEEGELAAIEALEKTQERLATLRARAQELAAQGGRLQAERKETAERLDAERADLSAQLEAQASLIPVEFRAQIEGNAAQGGVGAALISAGACGACGTAFSGRTAAAVAEAPGGQTFVCEECEVPLVKP
ncbi:hypothetical protein GSY69_03130 [Brevibacterium sp. 5221]|uniref:CT398-like coiled coil hairpin domain-containing protein n=1 Tax=Brevibacterium rongguiense TaxID=2695267 RepID=A0A6N9H4L0_9MICO|nr:hypothetical protein [Brevibacterium rongguiense]MYM18997.1 hypothetical protein [Brevibacterium rongguiense]